MQYRELADFLEHVGKDPSKLIFEDELTGIHNRRFLLSYLKHKVHWEGNDDFPLSLLILDLDHFKQINDTHGHDIGDQVLTWVASILQDVAGEDGLPVRYGGDEFMLVLPQTDADGARAVAKRLKRRVGEHTFRVRSSGTPISTTFSIGMATAPQDGRGGRALFRAADTALYHAKRSGRNQIASTEDVDLGKVFSKAALYRLEASGMVGREDELAAVSQALEALALGKSQFLLFDGPPGSGKTTLIENIGRNLTDHDLFHGCQVSGLEQEAYRPYYLATRVLTELLSQREDKGAAVLTELGSSERGYLSYLLPGLEDDRTDDLDADETARRAGIFRSLIRVLKLLLETRPLVLLIDDLQLADEATLLALRALLKSKDLSIIVCGTTTESMTLESGEDATPLERFLNARQAELGIRKRRLAPLTSGDIAHHLRSLFPDLQMPRGFDHDLAEITQGNPLFLGEVIRKLVVDQKVMLTGNTWVLEEVDAGYLPQSLEEVVSEQIAALDDRDRAMLERASLLGEDVSLSMLTGGSNRDESDVLDFLDRAEALGLVKLDFELNDETMRFLGKRVLELSYGNISEEQRTVLHEEIGNYQETLYERNLMPSASLLAYHFKRSDNREKARRYERVSLAESQAVFDASEAEQYPGLPTDEEADLEEKLPDEALAELPAFVRAFVTGVRNVKLYPPESSAIEQSHAEIKRCLDRILDHAESFHLSQSRNVLLANGQRIDVSEFRNPANTLRELLTGTDLQGLVFSRGASASELAPLLQALSEAASNPVERGFWKRFIEQHGFEHLQLRQVRYSEVRRAAVKRDSEGTVQERHLDEEAQQAVPRLLRAFRAATNNIKLYPIGSDQVTESIEEVRGALGGILQRRSVLNLSITGDSLLANGERLATASYATLAEGFIEFMRESGLESLTFLSTIKANELHTFFGALKDLPGGAGTECWEKLGEQHGLTGIFFNQREYSVDIVQGLLLSELDEDEDEDIVGTWARQIEEDPEEALRQVLPTFGRELLAQGEDRLLRRLLRRIFRDYAEQDPRVRLQIVHAVVRLINNLVVAPQYKFAKVAARFLIEAIRTEVEPNLVHELTAVLNLMADTSLQFSDYDEAGRIFTAMRERHEELIRSDDTGAVTTGKLITPRLDVGARALLEDDLKSGDAGRRESVAQILGSLGWPGAPLLVEVIKQDKDFRTRQMAATLLAGMGPEAGEVIKRALNVEVTVEQRFRILEIIDIVTHDVRDELAYSLGDSNPKIRRAAFRLADRLQDDTLIDILLPFAASDDPNVVKGAIRSLAELGSNAAVEAICEALDKAKEPELATACCQALGQIGHPGGVDALEQVLARRRLGLFGNHWDDQVRATAALSLRQIHDVKAARVLARFADDRDPRIRQLSSTAAKAEASGEYAEFA